MMGTQWVTDSMSILSPSTSKLRMPNTGLEMLPGLMAWGPGRIEFSVDC